MSARKCNCSCGANYLKIKFENVLYIHFVRGNNLAAFCVILGARIKLSYCRPPPYQIMSPLYSS